MAFCRLYICASFKFQVNLIHVASTCKNAADEKLRQTIRRFADIHGSPAAIIIISGDINFAADLNDLRHRYSVSVCNRDFDTWYTRHVFKVRSGQPLKITHKRYNLFITGKRDLHIYLIFPHSPLRPPCGFGIVAPASLFQCQKSPLPATWTMW